MNIHREIVDKYQEFFNFFSQKYNLILTIEQIDEIVSESQKLENNLNKKSSPIVEGKTKSNVKNNTQTRRLAQPPSFIKNYDKI